jgi:protein O-GlcNAc transferase
MGKQFDKAVELHRSGQLAEAEKVYESLYRRDRSDPDVALHLGLVRLGLERNEAALQPLRRAALIAPRSAHVHNALGEAFDRLGMIGEAVDARRRAVSLKPQDAHLQLAFGAALLANQEAEAALAAFDAAIAADPSLVHAHNNAGLALKMLGCFDEAAERFEAAMAVEANHAAAAFNLGNMLSEQGRMVEAEPWLKKAVELAPDMLNARFAFANLLRETGRRELAAQLIDQVLDRNPNDPVARVWRCVFELPVLYRDQSEIDRCRARYAGDLLALAQDVERDPKHFLPGFATTRPFLLAYQGKGDRELQSLYGGMLEKVVAAWVADAPARPRKRQRSPDERTRLGIVSGYFYNHSVWKIPTRGWLSSLDRSLFEVVCYHTSALTDGETDFARLSSDAFVQGPLRLSQWAERIAEDGYDILLYPEVGMDPMALQLAALRLAPVQANGLGHPVTSGLSTMDVALTSAAMEPEAAERDYVERLERLPNLGVYYEPLETPASSLTRADIGLSDEAFVFWCPQSLFKYQPRFDDVYPRIAAEAPDVRFVFINYHAGEAATAIFIDRLERRFAKAGLEMRRHCVFLPRLSQAGFVATAGLCDAMLDSIEWSGFNSTLESFAHDLPLVSCLGTHMRGRHGAAILSRMDLGELVADSVGRYVEIAVRLTKDADYRQGIKAQIARAKPGLSRDADYAEALNRTLGELVS